MMKRKLLFSLCLISSSLIASAHALWIETTVNGTKGKAHAVSVYFGEYAENERDTVSQWFSNLKDVQVFITAPDGNKKQLSLTDAVDHYAGEFTPDQQGVYTIALAHTVADVYGSSKIEYYATGVVQVGNKNNAGLSAATHLALQPVTEQSGKGKANSVKVYNNGQSSADTKVVINSPDGWVKNIQTDASGAISFQPVGTGRYMLEAIYSDKTPGTHNGKAYQSVSHLVTHCVYVD